MAQNISMVPLYQTRIQIIAAAYKKQNFPGILSDIFSCFSTFQSQMTLLTARGISVCKIARSV
jgi:hypothetical protein